MHPRSRVLNAAYFRAQELLVRVVLLGEELLRRLSKRLLGLWTLL